MKNISDFLDLFMTRTDFPADACGVFRDIHTRLHENESAGKAFDAVCTLYDFGVRREVLAVLDRIAEQIGVTNYAIELFFFMYLADALRTRYEAADLDEQIYWDSMTDLRAKLLECQDVYGIWGSFVASWFFGFFEMTRFALGRLQFEIETFSNNGAPYTAGGYTLPEGNKVVNMHIPSLGPLKPELVLDAFKRAYNFKLFADVRIPGTNVMPFVCHSWLLYPPHYDFLPKHSNILKFMDCFDIIDYDESDIFGNKWRVFGKDKDTEPALLPTDTSLRRAYAERLRAGEKTGNGFGVILFDGEKILNK